MENKAKNRWLAIKQTSTLEGGVLVNLKCHLRLGGRPRHNLRTTTRQRQEPLKRYPDGKCGIFLPHFSREKLTYPKIATGKSTGGVMIEYGSRVR